MFPTFLKRSEAHFRKGSDKPPFDIGEEVELARLSEDVRTLVPLTREGIVHLSKYFPPVRNAADLDELPKKLKKGEEFGFSPLFDPVLVDECCQRGIFPLTHDIGNGFFIFSPKVHEVRAVCALVDSAAERDIISGFPFCEDSEGIFRRECVGLSKKLLKSPDEASRRPAFNIFMNREEDLQSVFTLIRKQHGENWLCKPLRQCILFMFFHPEKFKTKIIITAIRRVKYSSEPPVSDAQEIKEGELVAGEVGFLVGDVYSSASGAYCISGGGALQLCLTGLSVHTAGCRVWDLGMMMEYKKQLNCLEIPRVKWLKLMKSRCTISNANILTHLGELKNGRCVNSFLLSSSPAEPADPNSKAQQKKKAKIEAAARRRTAKKESN